MPRALGMCGWVGALAIATAATLGAQAVPGQLNLTERDAQRSFLESATSGYPHWGTAAAAFVALPAAARVTVIQAGFAWAKAYVKSPAFRTAYERARQDARPSSPEAQGTVDDELKRQIDEQMASLAESRKMIATLPAEQRKEMEAMLKETEAQLKSPEFLAMLRSGIEMERADARETYQSSLTEWEASYPASSEILIRGRLQAFLTECGDVDFGAKLQARDRKMVFVNPDYERKSANWKTCYRAGPEAVGAARTAATAWLKELPEK